MSGHWEPYRLPFLFDERRVELAAIETALDMIGIEPSKREATQLKLFSALVDFSRNLHAEERPKPAVLRKDLDDCAKLLLLGLQSFYDLSPAAKAALIQAAEAKPIRGGEGDIWPAEQAVHYTAHMLDTLLSWCKEASGVVPTPVAGRDPSNALLAFAVCVGCIYEQATGRRATRNVIRADDLNFGGPIEAGEYRRFINAVLSGTGQRVSDDMAKRAIAQIRSGENDRQEEQLTP